jgi:hypothetical protein
MQAELARRGLNVTPITPNVEKIDERERCHFLNVLLECFSSGTRGE